MMENLHKNSGKSLQEWIKIVKKEKLGKHGEILKYLKENHSFTHGYANLVAMKSRGTDSGSVKNKNELIERAENLPQTGMITEMLDDTLNGLHQMGELVENLQNFTRLDRAKTAKFDVTDGLKNVVYIAKSVIPTGITINEGYADLPEVTCNPSQLNQVFLNLINNAAHALKGSGKGDQWKSFIV